MQTIVMNQYIGKFRVNELGIRRIVGEHVVEPLQRHFGLILGDVEVC